MNKNIIKGLQSNFAPGLVVFLVALPLCLGIALASGAPPLSGVIAGIIGGLVIGFLSNSNISVSGPAAGLAAIVLAAITDLGAFELFLCAGLIAGILQFLLGILKAGSISNYFPNNVIEGMLAGIGIIILLKQIPHALGYDIDNFSSQSLFPNGFTDVGATINNVIMNIHWGATLVFVVSMLILIFWNKIPFLNKLKVLPSALAAVIIAIGVNEIFKISGTELVILPEHLVKLPVPESFSDLKTLVTFPDFSGFTNSQVWIVGATIAVVASIETLLCIEASDRMDEHKRITNTNRELRAQGIGNVISSIIGGLPITSVIVRSSANANAGATSKMSTIVHGALLLICVISIPFVLNRIPLSVLAAVLIIVGFKLAHPKKIKSFYKKGWSQFIPFAATVLAVVIFDLLKGVGIGLAISIGYILIGNMKRAQFVSRQEIEETDEIYITLAEEVSFLNKATIKNTLMKIKPNSKVIFNARKTSYIAVDILELIEDFTNVRAKEDNIEVELIGFKTNYKEYEDLPHPYVTIAHRRTI